TDRIDPFANSDDPPVIPEFHLAHGTIAKQPCELAIIVFRSHREGARLLTQTLAPIEGLIGIAIERTAVDPRHRLTLDALRTFGPLGLLTFNALRTFGPLEALALDVLGAFRLLNALALD